MYFSVMAFYYGIEKKKRKKIEMAMGKVNGQASNDEPGKWQCLFHEILCSSNRIINVHQKEIVFL